MNFYDFLNSLKLEILKEMVIVLEIQMNNNPRGYIAGKYSAYKDVLRIIDKLIIRFEYLEEKENQK